MSESMSAPAASAASESAPASGAASDVLGQSGAGDIGNAPGVGQDAIAGDGSAQDSPAVTTPAEFIFNGRRYRDQAHAENAIQAMIGRVPHVQQENAQYQRQLAELQHELEALRALGLDPSAVQGGHEEKKAKEALQETLAKSGDLDFIAQLAEDPNIGLKGAIYELSRIMDERAEAREQAFLEQHVQPIIMQGKTEQTMTQVSRTLRELAQEFPELDPNNESPEAQQAQAFVLPLVKKLFKPEALAEMPDAVLGLAAMAYRETYGTPSIAQPPGSSGSPSAFAAEAAEAVAGGGPIPGLDGGNGVPRPGSGGNTPLDRIRRENREINSRTVKTPSGKVLWTE